MQGQERQFVDPKKYKCSLGGSTNMINLDAY